MGGRCNMAVHRKSLWIDLAPSHLILYGSHTAQAHKLHRGQLAWFHKMFTLLSNQMRSFYKVKVFGTKGTK